MRNNFKKFKAFFVLFFIVILVGFVSAPFEVDCPGGNLIDIGSGSKECSMDDGQSVSVIYKTQDGSKTKTFSYKGLKTTSQSKKPYFKFDSEGKIIEAKAPTEFFENPESERTKLFLSQIL